MHILLYINYLHKLQQHDNIMVMVIFENVQLEFLAAQIALKRYGASCLCAHYRMFWAQMLVCFTQPKGWFTLLPGSLQRPTEV